MNKNPAKNSLFSHLILAKNLKTPFNCYIPMF